MQTASARFDRRSVEHARTKEAVQSWIWGNNNDPQMTAPQDQRGKLELEFTYLKVLSSLSLLLLLLCASIRNKTRNPCQGMSSLMIRVGLLGVSVSLSFAHSTHTAKLQVETPLSKIKFSRQEPADRVHILAPHLPLRV